MDVLYYNDGGYGSTDAKMPNIAYKYNIKHLRFRIIFLTLQYVPTNYFIKYILQLSENVIFSNQCHRNTKHSHTGHTRTITSKMFE